MADKAVRVSNSHKNDVTPSVDKENDPKNMPGSERKKEEGSEEKQEDDIKLDIGEHYLVKRSDDTWRKFFKTKNNLFYLIS